MLWPFGLRLGISTNLTESACECSNVMDLKEELEAGQLMSGELDAVPVGLAAAADDSQSEGELEEGQLPQRLHHTVLDMSANALHSRSVTPIEETSEDPAAEAAIRSLLHQLEADEADAPPLPPFTPLQPMPLEPPQCMLPSSQVPAVSLVSTKRLSC